MRVGCPVPPHRKTHFGCVGSGKAHSAPPDTARMCFSVRASYRMRLSVECAFPHLGKRRAASRKTAFCPAISRKSAFCADALTQNRTPRQRSHGKLHSGGSEDPRVRLSVRASYRMRFSVRHGLQNASFRRVRFSSPGQTSSSLTQKRILCRRPHAKAHSAPAISRKSAFCADGLTGNRILCRCPHGKAHSAPTASRKTAFWRF